MAPVAVAIGLMLVACDPPPSVQAVDAWLTAYAIDDVQEMADNTVPADRDLLRQALGSAPTSTLALALPARPLSHEILEIERKEDAGRRHIVLCKVTAKNPLASMSKRVGHNLDIPRTRTHRRRFLSVRGPDGRWGVKLDLAQVVARAQLVQRFNEALARRAYDRAAALLQDIPAPPDEANAQRKQDRLKTTLQARLEAARRRSPRPRPTTKATPE